MKLSFIMEINAIYEGDNLEIMAKFPSKSVDLIYADPPFFSNRKYEVIWKDKAEIRSFEDRWEGGIEHYISWMEPRLRECHRILKDTGSIYLHCDWRANYKLRDLMNKIFGESNCQNEIIWKRSDAHSDAKQGAKHFGRVIDTILFYTKTSEYTFNTIYQPLPESTQEKWYKHIESETGRKYNLDNLTASKPGGDTLYDFQGVRPPEGRYWAYSKEKMQKMWDEGRIVKTKTGKLYFKRYLDESKGVPLQNLWTDISMLRGFDATGERLGYPTQKPVALLERIISVSSNKNDIVFDPFCGCGTALVASQRLGRKWIGIDISPTACKLMSKRLKKEFKISPMLIRGDVDLKYVKKLAPFEFQNWVIVDKFLGNVSARKSGDMGIDGFTAPLDGSLPIQVKQSEDIGRNVIDNFETAIRRMNKKKGYVVAFSFGRGAVEEAARVKNQEGIEIILRTVQDILDGNIE
jgi:DNA modification methylase